MRRTTLILADQRLRQLKGLAAERGQTLSTLVDQFLAEGIHRATGFKQRVKPLPVFNMGAPKVNIDDRDQLWEEMERG
jgi:hypothetical protein